MTYPLLDDGRLHSPYLIYVRADGLFSDADLLRDFGLAGYQPVHPAPRLGRIAVVADAGAWTLLADDWYYTLWHAPGTRPMIATLGAFWEVFACSVGESDRSFDFVYYRDGGLVRRYVVEDPHYRGGVVVVDDGTPLPGEAVAFRQDDEQRLLLTLAGTLGIPTTYNDQDVRVYAPPAARDTR